MERIMRKVQIEIDGAITLAECMRMAWSIGCTLRAAPGGRLLITRQPLYGLPGIDVECIEPVTISNVVPLRGEKCD